jgi:hypothetical protein
MDVVNLADADADADAVDLVAGIGQRLVEDQSEISKAGLLMRILKKKKKKKQDAKTKVKAKMKMIRSRRKMNES